MIKATWKQGFESLHKANPQLVADEIMSIGKSVTPDEIVEKARDESTELHKCFTWDDTRAAVKWRRHEARQIVCHLVIERPADAPKDKPEVRFFYQPVNGSGYKPTERILRVEDEYLQLMRQALGELIAFKRKYSMLSDSAELQALIRTVESEILSA